MADEKKLNIDMEEYSIPEEGSMGTYSNEQLPPILDGASKKPGGGKRLLVPVILIAAILVFYQILNWYSHRAAQSGLKEEQEIARKTQQSMVVQPLKAAESVAITPTEISLPHAVVTPADKDVQDKLDILANKTESNSQQVEKLQSSFLRSQTELVTLSRTVADLSSSVQDVAKQVQQLNTPKPKPKKIKKVEKPKLPKAVYHVKAIVPGLAWIESSDGAIISVRVGEQLKDYGTVQLISPQQGMVITSSGSVIQYGDNDF